jgi:hypothetical protein
VTPRRRFGLPRKFVHLAFVVGTLLVLGEPTLSSAHTPTPGNTGAYGNPQTFKTVGLPSWLAPVAIDELENYFHDSHNNSKVPPLVESSSGTATVRYSASSTSPCSGLGDWLQCSDNWGTNHFTIWIRDFENSGATGRRWWEKTSSCGGLVCWYVRRPLIDEASHAMLRMPDMCWSPSHVCLRRTA